MTERFVEKFVWRVIIMHLVFLVLFFASVRFAKGDTGQFAPATQNGQCWLTNATGGDARPW